MKRQRKAKVTVLAVAFALVCPLAMAQSDPGPRGGAAGAGGRVAGLTLKESKFFDSGLDSFGEVAELFIRLHAIQQIQPFLRNACHRQTTIACGAIPFHQSLFLKTVD